MIFFGSKGKVVGGEAMEVVQCPNCENNQFVTFGILNYFHLYWIPTFLTSREVGMECMHCKRTLVGDEVPSHLVDQIKSSVFSTSNTLPMFSGLIIIALLAMVGMYTVQQDNAREATYISQPKIDDYYVVDFTKVFVDADAAYKYGLMRVTDVTSTEIEFQIGSMVYNMASGIQQDIRDGKAAADSYYEPDKARFEFSELLELKDDVAIYSIERR